MINTPNGKKVTMLLEKLPFIPESEFVEIHKADTAWLYHNSPGVTRKERRNLNTTAFVKKGKALARRGEIKRIYFGHPGRALLLPEVQRLQIVRADKGVPPNPSIPRLHRFVVIDVTDRGRTTMGENFSRATQRKVKPFVMKYTSGLANGRRVDKKAKTEEGDVNNGL